MNQKSIKYCLSCGKPITGNKRRNLYCDNICQGQYKADKYIQRWLNGDENGMSGDNGISDTIRKYLFKKHGNSCELCGWSILNTFTNRIPLTIHHIDGIHLHNEERNLQLLCPNCHSLTENYGSRNKITKRSDRRK